ncbi:MAG: Hsp70 family protein [Cyanobacteria bacterium P01_A01_bin.135]
MAIARTYALDFGTSNTVLARWNQETSAAETVSLPGLSHQLLSNPPSIPSLLYVDSAASESVIAGQAVRDRGLDIASDSRFFQGFKRGIGTSIQGFLPTLDGRSVTFEDLGRWFLQKVVAGLPAESCEELVLTVPVDSYEAYRYWLEAVVQPLAVNRVRLIDEPTAAALGYGLAPDGPILVVDFGGGTLDLSLVQLSAAKQSRSVGMLLFWKGQQEASKQRPNLARVLAKAGDAVGGSDLDNWILDHFHKTQGLPRSPLTQRLCERLKIALSDVDTASEALFDDETLATYDLTLARPQFNEILEQRGFFATLEALVTQVLGQAQQQGIDTADIETVLLVGGGAKIPALQDWLRQRFGDTVLCGDRPLEAIAHGALQIANVDLKDFLYHGYGLRYWNRRQNRHDWHPLIPRGQPYPMDKPIELVLGASLEQQPAIELVLGELGASTTTTEIFFDGDRLVTRAIQSDQGSVKPLGDGLKAPLDPPGAPGADRVRFEFYVDEARQLRVSAEDLLTNRRLLDDKVLLELQ